MAGFRTRIAGDCQKKAGRQGRQPVRATAQLVIARFRWALRVVATSRPLGLVVSVAKKASLEVGGDISTIG